MAIIGRSVGIISGVHCSTYALACILTRTQHMHVCKKREKARTKATDLSHKFRRSDLKNLSTERETERR